MRNLKPEQLLRPTQHIEKILVTAILDGTYACGAALPNERSLAEQMGVTRPTLRETLQRLAGEGWITIHHGKPTVVNDYWQEGGLRLLGTLSRYSNYLPNDFIANLLEVRLTMLPSIAARAARFQPEILLDCLDGVRNLAEDAKVYADFDWKLQMFMARNSQNPVFSLILNDFAQIFATMAMHYFKSSTARRASRVFYRELSEAIEKQVDMVENVVKKAMQQSILIWQEVKMR
jgi:GntR family transcriptional regulator, negative regulator for fad regulon and positive regulator of fabA